MSMPMDKIIEDEQILTDSGFYWRERDGVKILVCRALEENGFINGFSTRLGGVSPFPAGDLNLAGFDEDSAENIYENRRRFLNAFNGDFQLATAWQVHGDGVKIVKTGGDAINSDDKFDSLVSDLDNILVGVKTADCVPILIADPQNRAFAAVHAGWRGTLQAIVAKTVDKLRENYGSSSLDLIAAIGPCASNQRYEVGADVVDAFKNTFPTCEHIFRPTREGHALIDLSMANEEQLLIQGLRPQNIKVAPFCTMARTDLFFSYRVEKKIYGKTGRLMSVIGRSETVS